MMDEEVSGKRILFVLFHLTKADTSGMKSQGFPQVTVLSSESQGFPRNKLTNNYAELIKTAIPTKETTKKRRASDKSI